MAKKTTTLTYRFRKGEQYHLDEIYEINGIANEHNWWKADDPSDESGTSGEEITITKNIEIKITVTAG